MGVGTTYMSLDVEAAVVSGRLGVAVVVGVVRGRGEGLVTGRGGQHHEEGRTAVTLRLQKLLALPVLHTTRHSQLSRVSSRVSQYRYIFTPFLFFLFFV